MRILDIIEATTGDGPGFRTAVYFAGCAHRCPGCHNPQSWDFEGGAEVSVEALADRLLEAGLDVTLSGGDPAYQAAEAALLARAVRSAGHTVWLYTGFKFEQLISTAEGRRLAESVDVVVDGPYVESLRDNRLPFRGSANQRIIDSQASLSADSVALWHSPFAVD
ncbi:MAG: anaerobic ribonucleoside-triphosphate reductase activating protein [Candidatus Amulumruptor sp.]|nr:anaerobic ribonucleoside-triphosphate reductase activating protein [Candidatus Amulumruptor sp.]